MNTTTTTRGLTPAQVHALHQISHHDNVTILVMFLCLAVFLSAGYAVARLLFTK